MSNGYGYQQSGVPQPAYFQQQPNMPGYGPGYRVMNKHIFVWIGAFLFGGIGIDRFLRGQIGMGIFKLLIGGWATLGIWPLVDWIIAMVKAYGQAYGNTEEIVFDASGRYIR